MGMCRWITKSLLRSSETNKTLEISDIPRETVKCRGEKLPSVVFSGFLSPGWCYIHVAWDVFSLNAGICWGSGGEGYGIWGVWRGPGIWAPFAMVMPGPLGLNHSLQRQDSPLEAKANLVHTTYGPNTALGELREPAVVPVSKWCGFLLQHPL